MEKKKTITAQDVKDVCAFIAGKADSIFAPKAPQGENVTPYFDTDGTFQGVRVCALGEDFVIDAKDFQGGKEMPWSEAMDALKAAGKTTWNLPQLYLTMFFRKQVDAILKKNGGDPMDNRGIRGAADCDGPADHDGDHGPVERVPVRGFGGGNGAGGNGAGGNGAGGKSARAGLYAEGPVRHGAHPVGIPGKDRIPEFLGHLVPVVRQGDAGD